MLIQKLYIVSSLILFTLIFSSCSSLNSTINSRSVSNTQGPAEKPMQRFSIGSCSKSNLPQPLWPIITKQNPELFIWMGDNVYLDTENLNEMNRIYAEQESIPSYKEFKKEVPIIGTWDDHDFGNNDVGKEYPLKEQSQKLFLDFIGEPANSLRRSQKGIYATYTYGPADQEVRIILLDVRYHREKPGKPKSDVLGEEQWKWFEDVLKTNTAKVTFLVSSISLLSESFPRSEEWADFKWEKKKLFHLVNKYKTSGFMILTGDRHFSAYLPMRVHGRKYHELMSSGMTHNKKSELGEKVMRFYYGKENTYFERSFANIDLDWNAEPMQMKFSAIGVDSQVHLEKSFYLNKKNNWVLVE